MIRKCENVNEKNENTKHFYNFPQIIVFHHNPNAAALAAGYAEQESLAALDFLVSKILAALDKAKQMM